MMIPRAPQNREASEFKIPNPTEKTDRRSWRLTSLEFLLLPVSWLHGTPGTENLHLEPRNCLP